MNRNERGAFDACGDSMPAFFSTLYVGCGGRESVAAIETSEEVDGRIAAAVLTYQGRSSPRATVLKLKTSRTPLQIDLDIELITAYLGRETMCSNRHRPPQWLKVAFKKKKIRAVRITLALRLSEFFDVPILDTLSSSRECGCNNICDGRN